MGFGRRLEVSTGLEYSDLKVKYAQRPESMTKYRNIKYRVLTHIYIHTCTAFRQHCRKSKNKRNKSHITKSACRIRMRKVPINI